jgi:hypothetical protein
LRARRIENLATHSVVTSGRGPVVARYVGMALIAVIAVFIVFVIVQVVGSR